MNNNEKLKRISPTASTKHQ